MVLLRLCRARRGQTPASNLEREPVAVFDAPDEASSITRDRMRDVWASRCRPDLRSGGQFALRTPDDGDGVNSDLSQINVKHAGRAAEKVVDTWLLPPAGPWWTPANDAILRLDGHAGPSLLGFGAALGRLVLPGGGSAHEVPRADVVGTATCPIITDKWTISGCHRRTPRRRRSCT